MITYKFKKLEIYETEPSIVFRSDGACIPFDPANTDYQEYLKWLEAGNTPEPPDSQE